MRLASRIFFAALLLLHLVSDPARAELSRELIVHLAPDPPQPHVAYAARLAPVLEALGLTALRRLDDGLPAPHGSATRLDLLSLDPSPLLLVAARDSAGAKRARAALMTDPAVLWVETNAVREATVLPPEFPDDPLFVDTRQWGLMNAGPTGVFGGLPGADIHAREAWALSVGSNQV